MIRPRVSRIEKSMLVTKTLFKYLFYKNFYLIKSQYENYDVIIIGGGLSGIKAFINLKKSGLNALIIEKSSYLGGRAFSFQDPLTGNYIDNGQHVIVGACKEYLNLLKETNNEEKFLKIKNYQVPVIKNNKVSVLGSKFLGAL